MRNPISIRTRSLSHPVLLALALLAASCSNSGDEPIVPETGKTTVFVGAGTATRTTIDPNGIDTRWTPGDRIALWAVDEQGSQALTAEPFTLYYYGDDYATALFTAQIEPLTQDRYTYRACYPLPESLDGSTVAFDIPARQTGVDPGAHAVMMAYPTEGTALAGGTNPELTLSFRHCSHLLRITIPEDKNLLGEPIEELEITFPVPVTGRLTLNALDPDAPSALTDGSNTLRLTFPEAVEAGSTVWAVIAPTDLSEGEIVFRAFSARYESQKIAATGRNFKAGHTTPLRLTVPHPKVGYLHLSLSEINNLGQDVRTITLTAPEGAELNPGITSHRFTTDATNDYTYACYRGLGDLAGQLFTVTFESDDAIVTSTFVMPDTEDQGDSYRTTVEPLDVPYLLFEDFSSLTDNPRDNDNSGLLNYNATDLSSYNLPGWSISRAQGSGGACLCLRHYVAFNADYYARINSAPMSAIKAGHTVDIEVTFNGAAAADDMRCIVGGYDSATKALPGTGDGVDIYSNEIVIVLNKDYASYTTMSPDAPRYEFTVAGVGPTIGLSWKTSANLTGFAAYKDTYIDNVKVSIKQ